MQLRAEQATTPVSYLTPIGYQAASCGYCKSEQSSQRTPNSRNSYFAVSNYLDVEHYQALIDRGWRRSGTLLYKPDVRLSCCPHYTIRLPAAEFKPSKDQRQAMNRWNKYVLGDHYIKEASRLYPKSKEDKARQRNGFDLVNAVHESEYNRVRKPPEPAHRFEVTLEPDNFTEEKYQLFENYQRNVHHETPSQISRSGFKRFLCSSNLQRTSRTFNGARQDLGSFHQCYRLDGRLIAMGVLDLLPHCVSGVYFIYHEDYERWSFGKLSALREASLALEGGYRYYYMGYYIHSCMKMRYKGDYKPQYILDPVTHEWSSLEKVKPLLDAHNYVSLTHDYPMAPSTPKAEEAVQCEPAEREEKLAQPDVFKSPAEAAEAVEAGLSLFVLGMPGVMTPEELLETVNLDRISLSLRNRPGRLVQMEDLVAWQEGSLLEPRSLKGMIAEFAACVGPQVTNEMVVQFST